MAIFIWDNKQNGQLFLLTSHRYKDRRKKNGEKEQKTGYFKIYAYILDTQHTKYTIEGKSRKQQ